MSPTTRIHGVRFEHHREPFGIGERRPRAVLEGRRPTAAGWRQSAYEIEVREPEAAAAGAPGRVESDESVLVPLGGAAAGARASAAPSASAPGGRTATGRRPGRDAGGGRGRAARPGRLDGALVAPAGEDERPVDSPARCCGASSTLRAGVAAARLYVTALGVYELELNGVRVGDHVLAPGWTSYDHRLRYQTFDVTALLRAGRQRASARMLADGWYRGRLGFERRAAQHLRRPAGAARPARGHLRRRRDRARRHRRRVARRRTGRSSPRASTTARPTTRAWSGRAGRRRATTTRGWRRCGRAARRATRRAGRADRPAGAAHGAGRAGRDHDVAVRARRSSTSARTSSAGCASRVAGEAGPDDHAAPRRGAARTASSASRPAARRRAPPTRYTLRGGGRGGAGSRASPSTASATPRSTAGRASSRRARSPPSSATPTWSARAGSSARTRCSTACTRTSSGACAATSSTCRPTARSATSAWAGRATCRSSRRPRASSTTARGFLTSWLRDLAADQDADGDGARVRPVLAAGIRLERGARREIRHAAMAAWGDAAVIVPWVLYQRFGDVGSPRAGSSTSMRGWVDHVAERGRRGAAVGHGASSSATGSIPSAPPDRPALAATDPHLVATAYLARLGRARSGWRRACSAAPDDAGALRGAGRRGRAPRSTASTSRPPAAWPATRRPATRSRSSSTCCPRPTSSAGARGRAARRARARARATDRHGLRRHAARLRRAERRRRARRPRTGCCSSASARRGCTPVTMGATTVWERWDSLLPDGTVNPGEMTSFNHYALGAVADWLHRTVAGLAPGRAGLPPAARSAPRPGGGLRHAAAAHETPYGRAEVRWERGGRHPRGRGAGAAQHHRARRAARRRTTPVEVGPGTHRFSIPFPAPEEDEQAQPMSRVA